VRSLGCGEPLGRTASLDNSQEERTAIRSGRMRVFALAEIGDSEAIDVFLRREDA